MARNKNRKKSSAKGKNQKNPASVPETTISQTPSSPVKPELVQENKRKAPAAEEKQASPQQKIKNPVRLSTCVAGMFLTFVLGIYLGSFLPGIMRGMEEEKQIPQASMNEKPLAAPPASPAAVEARPEAERKLPAPPRISPQASIPAEMLEHIRHLEKDAISQPGDARVWTELGNAYFDVNEPQKAISAYEHSLAISPDNPDVWTDLGIMYREIKNLDKALECFRRAQQQDPKHINAIFNEGVVLSTDLGRKEEAARVWTRILDIDPAAATPNGQKIADMVRQLQ